MTEIKKGINFMWDFKDERAIYLQIIEYIKLRIFSGEYAPGSKLLSIRKLAEEASVSAVTMQKALMELERQNLIYTHRTKGRFIADDKNIIAGVKQELGMAYMADFLEKMKNIGFSKNEILDLFTGY